MLQDEVPSGSGLGNQPTKTDIVTNEEEVKGEESRCDSVKKKYCLTRAPPSGIILYTNVYVTGSLKIQHFVFMSMRTQNFIAPSILVILMLVLQNAVAHWLIDGTILDAHT